MLDDTYADHFKSDPAEYGGGSAAPLRRRRLAIESLVGISPQVQQVRREQGEVATWAARTRTNGR